ncbi:hypothetical protein MSAN_00334900 [Mycena sanguinolenta]|uniref:Uncharacterized protein n=1 Tax=Mycena sanguinolenta TaxID=230812 RepID=A0A8H7DJE6_9AGAR|nr:hypothetical protein MSAN_00334900 [Mycena sanguinolenta]
MSNERTPTEKITSSKPIPIMPSPFPRGRPRSLSVSSGESSGSASSPTEIPTPLSSSATSPRVNASPGTSPILSYFLAQSPTKSPGTFPFRKLPVFEEEDADVKDLPAVSHARRASTAVAGRFAQNPNPALPDAHNERGQGLLRRLSLSATFMNPPDGKRSPPNVPPNTAVSPTQATNPFGRDARSPRRAATLSAADGRPRRAPSPMGERILKGHFDGFN